MAARTSNTAKLIPFFPSAHWELTPTFFISRMEISAGVFISRATFEELARFFFKFTMWDTSW